MTNKEANRRINNIVYLCEKRSTLRDKITKLEEEIREVSDALHKTVMGE